VLRANASERADDDQFQLFHDKSVKSANFFTVFSFKIVSRIRCLFGSAPIRNATGGCRVVCGARLCTAVHRIKQQT
jgi:hypothetical protein